MEDIKYEMKIGEILQWNSNKKAPNYAVNKEAFKKYGGKGISSEKKYYFGVQDTFKSFDKKSNFYWSYWETHNYPYDGNTDGRRREIGYKTKKNPLILIDRTKELKLKTFDDLVLEKVKKTNIDINFLIQYKKEDILKELPEVNLEILKINDGIFLWKHVISNIVIRHLFGFHNKLNKEYGIFHNLGDQWRQGENLYDKIEKKYTIKIFDRWGSKNQKGVYKTLCTYTHTKSHNEYIFDFGDVPNEYIKNNFEYMINGIIYKSK